MTKTDIYQFDTTDANNTDLEGIDTATGWAPNQVGPAFRALMGRLARVCQGLAPWNSVIIDGAAATSRPLWFSTAFSSVGTAGYRWLVNANTTAEAGSNAGSDLAITPYSDAGAALTPAVTIKRSTGTVTLAAGATVSGHDSGGFDFRSINGTYGVGLRNDGTNTYLLQTASGSSTGSYNAYRPLYWNLSTGIVTIDGTGRGVTMGGAVAVSGAVNIGGGVSVGGVLGVAGVSSFAGLASFSGSAGGSASGYVYNATGATAYSGTYSASISATGNILSSLGFFCTSDERVKSDISTIPPEEGRRFVEVSRPVVYIKGGVQQAGFIAQEQHKAGYAVSFLPSPGLPETVDADGYVSPADTMLAIDYNERIAFLTAALKDAFARISSLEAK